MLTQQEADALILLLKELRETNAAFPFPIPGDYKRIDLMSADGRSSFIVDINRRGSVNLVKKCTYQARYQRDIPLLRLDVDGPEHTNPDGGTLGGMHLHIYKEGYGDRYAIPLPHEVKDSNDLLQTLIDFLSLFHVENANDLQIEAVI